jgi:hypothetical protein
MIEAKIICSHPCDIPDLGITGLKRGEERWVSISAADASQDLLKEQRKGNVRVYRKVRRRETAPRRPAPPFVAASRPRVPERKEPEVIEKHHEVERVVEASVNVEELARRMKSELIGDLIPDIKEAIAQEVGKALAQQPQQPQQPRELTEPAAPAMDAAQLESLLESVLRRVGVQGGGTASQQAETAEGPEDPLFIPSVIIDKGAKGKITVKSKKSKGTDDLDDAQAALREMKRARRGKKKDNEEK